MRGGRRERNMSEFRDSRRSFLKNTALSTGAVMLSRVTPLRASRVPLASTMQADSSFVDYTIRIRVSPVEIAKNHIVSMTNYNGQFPGPLIRLKEGEPVTVEIVNETDVPEQLHWHGQKVPVDADGASEEG